MKNKLVIVMDSGRLRAFRIEGNEIGSPRFTQIEDRQTTAEDHISELVSDQTGQFGKGSRGADAVSASGERHNIDLEIRRRAIKALAKRASEVVDREQPEEIYFAAGSEINQLALDAMTKGMRDRIRRNVTANLTNLRTPEIMARFIPPSTRPDQVMHRVVRAR
jgi:hypothetical protein